MTWDRVAIVEDRLDTYLSTAEPAPSRLTSHAPLNQATTLTASAALGLYEDQLASRQIDVAARELKKTARSFYTISSAGHENNAVLGARLRIDDPAFLHYRSGGFFMARSHKLPGATPVLDTLLGVVASSEDPISQGRHKVWGSRQLWIPPQTSTIASHLPKAMGLAFSLARAKRIGVGIDLPADAIVMCSFGDASANHSTSQGAINAARYTAHQGLPLPLLFVCEDNGWGISVPTPSRWIESAFGDIAELRYEFADGSDLADTYDVVRDLAAWVRSNRRPAFLHLRTVRFMGHAGTDVESGYRSITSIRDDELRDPILGTARLLVSAGLRTPDELRATVLSTRAAVRELATSMIGGPTLTNAEAVMAPLSPRCPDAVLEHVRATTEIDRRATFFGDRLPESEGPLTLAETINRTLGDLLAARPDVLVFGEDVGVKGGVYGVTRGLQKRAGAARVFDSLLDEQSILGIALGTAVSGLLPIPEIQYLAYLHNAEDQLRGEAASLSFFSQGRYRNPMVVRVAGLAYQKGFGGHFHNDNAVGVLRDIPGLVIACPGHPADAAPMLRTCAAAAVTDGTVAVFLEPIALYHTRDLHDVGDEGWMAPYAAPDEWAATHVPIGEGRIARDGSDVLIVTWANGLYLSLRAAERLAADGISCRVLDMRWLAPLPIDQIVHHANEVGRVVVVDETRRSGGVGEAVLAALVDHRVDVTATRRVTARDTFIPLGDAALCVLVSEDDIVDAVREVAAGP